jgi:alkanesulfonate monooxygenase SsuD/methylene tetrahydromethanopterin reductase-like flavin-dependent oxidoreductase (luciferase family)
LRLAEDAAVVDILSGGRLDLGIAPGYRTREFEALGVPKSQRGTRTDETIEIIRKAWSGERFSHEGRHFSFADVEVQPTPLQDPLPLWIGGSSEASARRAAKYSSNYLPDSGAPREVYDVYRRELEDSGAPGAQLRIATNRVLYVCEDPQEGWDEVKDHYKYVFNTYRKWFAEAGDFPELGEPLEDADKLSRELHIVGTPDDIAAEIERLRSAFPVDTLIFWARPAGLSIDLSSRSLELFARQVLPRFTTSSHNARAAGGPPPDSQE